MAYIVSSIDAAPVTSGATYEVEVGGHQSGDIMLIELANDGGVTGISMLNSSVTVDAALDTLTYSGSDYWTDGDPIFLTGTTAPGGTTLETKYFVRDLNTGAKTFKIAATAGGTAINITSTGTAVVANLIKAGTNHPFVGWDFGFISTRNTTGGFRKAIAFKVATDSSDEAPLFYGNNDDWNGTAHVIRDADTTFLSSLSSGTDYNFTHTTATGNTVDNPSLTTATNGCLLLYMALMDGNAVQGRTISPKPDNTVALQKFSSSTFAMATSYTQQQSAGAIPTVTFYKSNASAVTYLVFAIRNATGGALQPVPRFTSSVVAWFGAMATNHDPTFTWDDPAALFGATLDGIVCSSTVPTVTQNVTALNYGGAANIAVTENASLTESPAGSGIWAGAWTDLPSTDMSNKIAAFVFQASDATTSNLVGRKGYLVAFGDGTNWAAFKLQSKSTGWVVAPLGFFIGCAGSGSTPFASSGTLNWAAITRFGIFVHRTGASTTTSTLNFKHLLLISRIDFTGGGANRPLTVADFFSAGSWASSGIGDLQGVGQMLGKVPMRVGDGGSNTTYFDAESTSFEFPKAWSATSPTSQNKWNVAANMVSLSIKAGASDTVRMSAGVAATDTQQGFDIDSASSTSAAYSFVGMSFVGWLPTLKTGIDITGATFSECGEIAAKGVNFTNCTIKKTVSTDASISWTENGATVDNTEIDVTGTSANYHIELGTSVTAITLTDVTFTGTPGVDKVHVLATTGTVTITIDGTTSLVAGDVTSAGATVSIVAPTFERGLEFTGLIAGSQVKVFSTGTDTELFSTNSSGTTETWDDATTGSITVDYVIQKAGYVPIRVTGVVVTGAVGTGVISTAISQVVDRAYVASSGLAIGGGTPNVFVNTTTKKIGLSAASTLQNYYSYLIEQWIALGDTGEALANKKFPFEPTGTNSFSLLDGWEFDTTTYPNSITSLSGDGLRYLNASRVTTAQWACLVAVGVPAGKQVRLQQSDGGTTVTASATGEIDELFQVYGDASHGNFDKRGYMIAKVQSEGYDQAEVDVVDQYGSLEDYSYTIALLPTPNGVATGDPGITGVTITDHGATPVAWNPGAGLDKNYSITIRDEGSNTGENILRWLRYNFAAGGTFQGKNAFDWHDLVSPNGTSFKSVNGIVYGDTGSTLKGVRVLTGASPSTTPHPDFNLFTADDGTTATPPAAAVSRGLQFTGLVAGSKVVVFDTGTTTERFNVASSGTSETWEESTAGSVTVDYVIMIAGHLPIRVAGITVTASTAGVNTVPVSQVDDRSYVASSGLTIGVNAFATAGTKKFGLSAASTVQNFYSYMIEQWIALGDGGEALANVEFPIITNGPNSFSLMDGWEFDVSTYPNSITNLSRDGMRYLDTGENITAVWAAILTSGVPAGARVRFQQVEGTTQSAAVTSGDMDQLVQVYGDASHGNFDYRNYLILKVQESGYDEAVADAVATYGTLEDQLYVVGLAPTANGVATGDPALTITITDHGASPVTWNGKVFSITITDNASASSGTNIMRELRHNFEAGGTYQGKDGFNWHDLVRTNGSKFKTVRGPIYGDAGASLKGVRVVQSDGTSAHADFDLFTADDGTTYVPPLSVTLSVNNVVAGSRVQIFNTDTNTEMYNEISAGTTFSKSILYTADVNIRVRVMYVNGASDAYKWWTTTGTITAGGFSVNAAQEVNTVYNTNGVDGSTVTECSINGNKIDIDVDDPDNTTTAQRIYNWYQYYLFTAAGIRDSDSLISATDSTHYVFDNTVQIKNLDTLNPLNITGANIVPQTGAATNVFDLSNGASMAINFNRVEGFAFSSGSGLSVEEHGWLDTINSKAARIQDTSTVATSAEVASGGGGGGGDGLTLGEFLALK